MTTKSFTTLSDPHTIQFEITGAVPVVQLRVLDSNKTVIVHDAAKELASIQAITRSEANAVTVRLGGDFTIADASEHAENLGQAIVHDDGSAVTFLPPPVGVQDLWTIEILDEVRNDGEDPESPPKPTLP